MSAKFDYIQDHIQVEVPELKNGGIKTIGALDLHAEGPLSELAAKLYKENPASFKGISESTLNQHLSSIFHSLNPDLRMEQKLDLLEKLCTKTMANGPMSAENYLAGNQPGGKLLILEKSGEYSTLEYLSKLAATPLYADLQTQGYTNQQILTSLIQDLVTAGNTQQGINTASCSVTCAQSYQLNEDPALIAGRITELATTGKSGNLKLPLVIPSDDRTICNALYQSVMMNAADNGFDPLTDTVNGKMGTHKGLFSRQLWDVLNQATGKPHQIAYQGEDIASIIRGNLDQRKELIAVVSGIGSGDHLWHDVRVIDQKSDGYTYFLNPWPDEYLKSENGIEVLNKETGLCRMSTRDFMRNTEYLAYETNNAADFKRAPDGRDEKDFVPAPAQVFTISISEYTPLTFEELNRLRKLREMTETKKKPENIFEENAEKLRKRLLEVKEN